MAALYVPVYLAVLALPLPLEVAEPGVETSRVELMTNEVVGIEVIAVPTWTSKYMAWKCIREKRWGLASCILVALREELTAMGSPSLLDYLKHSGGMLESIRSPGCIPISLVGHTDM